MVHEEKLAMQGRRWMRGDAHVRSTQRAAWLAAWGLGAILLAAPATALDTDGDGTPDPLDCQPANAHIWAAPSDARDLRVTGRSPITLAWSAPSAAGADFAPRYDVLRSATPYGFAGAVCAASGLTVPTVQVPAGSGIAFFLVRSVQYCGSTLGTNSSGVPITGPGCGTCPSESCNGIDDDCSGLVDDHTTAPTNLCATQGVCAGQSIPVVCLGAGGWRCNYTGVPNVELDASNNLTASELRCDARDGNCNGTVDIDGFSNKGQSCTVGLGICQRGGTFVCNAPQTATVCSATPGNAGTETCNGLDDDCDGTIDNHLTPPTNLCSSQGVCAGQSIPVVCTGAGGWWCNYSSVPNVDLDAGGNLRATESRCADGRDNNCNGVIDDGCP